LGLQGIGRSADTNLVLIEGENEIRLRCDRCGAQMILGGNARQVSLRRRPSGWVSESGGRDLCPLCSRGAIEAFRSETRRR
jgi:hypothetical protein